MIIIKYRGKWIGVVRLSATSGPYSYLLSLFSSRVLRLDGIAALRLKDRLILYQVEELTVTPTLSCYFPNVDGKMI